jgi:hypothetical protein
MDGGSKMKEHRNTHRAWWGIALFMALLVPVACDDTPTDPADPANGDGPPDASATTVSVYLMDAPGEVADVWVEAVDVALRGGPHGEVSLLEEPTELISLLDLQDHAMLLAAEREVEPGTYNEIRFVIGGAVLETTGGDVYVLNGAEHPGGLAATGQLHCPSCQQSGIKAKFASNLEVEEGHYGILLDFDVSQSFGRQAGQSGRWVMHPVIQGVIADPADIEDGLPEAWIEGTVELALDPETDEPVELPVCGDVQRTLADFVPVASSLTDVDDEGDPFTFSGSTSAEGVFEISVWQGAEYGLGYWGEIVIDGGSLVWEAEVSPEFVEVAPGEQVVSGVSYVVTDAVCIPDENGENDENGDNGENDEENEDNGENGENDEDEEDNGENGENDEDTGTA